MNTNTNARQADASLLVCFSFRSRYNEAASGSRARRQGKKVTRRARRRADKAACVAVS